jgi:polar amino acid transport system substrate-binding protein
MLGERVSGVRRVAAMAFMTVLMAGCGTTGVSSQPSTAASSPTGTTTASSLPAGSGATPGSSDGSASGESVLDRIQRTHILTAGVFSFAPLIFTDPASGAFTGEAVDTLSAFAKSLNVDLNLTMMPTASFVLSLQTNRIDIFPELNKTPEREQQIDFSDPVLCYASGIFVNSENPTVSAATPDALQGKKVAVTRGGFEMQEAALIPNVQLIQLDTAEETFLYVSQGRADAAVQAQVLGDYGIPRNPNWKVKLLGQVPVQMLPAGIPQQQPQHYGVPKGPQSATFLAKINDFIKQIHQDGSLKTILAKYGMTADSYISCQ